MGFAINTNLDALNAYQNLTNTQNALSKSLQQLSSGLRINNAGDDAAGMTIATDIGAQVSGLTKAQANAADGTSVVQTADGALTQVQTLLGQLRDLAVQAANDSNSTSARTALSTQATAIVSQISQLGNSTNFNGIYLLNGTAGTSGTLNFQVGADGNANNQISVNLAQSGASANVLTVATTLASGTNALTFVGSSGLTAIQSLGTVSSAAGDTFTPPPALATALSSATSASAAAALLNSNAAFSAGFSATVSTAAGVDTLSITADDGSVVSATTSASGHASIGASVTNAGKIDLTTSAGAQAAITSIQTQLDNVSAARANIGALENRFTAVTSSLSTSITNLTAAKSRITDVDMASAMVTFSKQNILAQAGTAMLSQANSLPQLALKLLQS